MTDGRKCFWGKDEKNIDKRITRCADTQRPIEKRMTCPFYEFTFTIYQIRSTCHIFFLLNTFAFWTYTPLRHCETRQVQLGHSYSQSRIVFYEEKMHPFNKIISRDRLKDVSRIFKLLFLLT